MKFKLLNLQNRDWTGKPTPGAWKQAVSFHVDAVDAAAALVIFRRQILWLTPEMNLRCEPATSQSLGAQLWEPCERCGTEPNPTAISARHDHPRISRVPYHSVEPEEAK